MNASVNIPRRGDALHGIDNLTGSQKAAILMMLLGEDEASNVFTNLSPQEVQHLGATMFTIRDVDRQTVDQVLDEFLRVIMTETGLGLDSGNYIRNAMTTAIGGDKAQSVLSRITPNANQRPIELLDWMDAPSIAELIMDEHLQIIALVIAFLKPALGAAVLFLMPEETQPDIITRIASLNTVQPEALEQLEYVMKYKFKSNTTLRASQIGGVKAAANIMNVAKQPVEQRILKEIRKDNRDLMQAIQDNMFVFENLGKSDDRSLQTMLRSIEGNLLAMALKGTDERLRQKLLNCMSTRAAEGIRDEMEGLGPVRLSDVQRAQKEIIEIARRLSDEGTIFLAGRGGEEMV